MDGLFCLLAVVIEVVVLLLSLGFHSQMVQDQLRNRPLRHLVAMSL